MDQEQRTRTDEECLEIIQKDWPDYMDVARRNLEGKLPLEPLLSVLEWIG